MSSLDFVFVICLTFSILLNGAMVYALLECFRRDNGETSKRKYTSLDFIMAFLWMRCFSNASRNRKA